MTFHIYVLLQCELRQHQILSDNHAEYKLGLTHWVEMKELRKFLDEHCSCPMTYHFKICFDDGKAIAIYPIDKKKE